MTNREWLFSLTDEELARAIDTPCPKSEYRERGCEENGCKESGCGCWVHWLREEHHGEL